MIFNNFDRIVFAGDSVTDMGSVQPVGEGLFDNVGHGYVRIVKSMLAAFYPEIYLRVTNSGISGDTSRDLLTRFERDVIGLKPDWVSICIGINDVWRQFDSPAITDTHVLPDEYVTICSKLSEKYECIFVDFQKMFEEYCQIRHSSYLAWDRIHPNYVGSVLMACAFLDDVDLIRTIEKRKNNELF